VTAVEPWIVVVLAAAGVASGVVNVIAGGGSLLTLPALMLFGLPANVANGTNRVSVLSQSLAGVWAFHRKGKIDVRAVPRVLVPTVLGSGAGAGAAAIAPVWLLKPAMLATMVVVALLMALGGKKKGEEKPADDAAFALSPTGWLGVFAAGVYGGFIQAGVGFVLLAVLERVLHHDLVRANAFKLVCTMIFGAVALGVFVVAGQVSWVPGLVLAAATVVGSQLGVRVALRIDAALLRWIVVGCVVVSSAAILLRG
jgi:uncharacterized protein